MSETKTMPPCRVCGSVTCYGICPMADPYAEHRDHVAGVIHVDARDRFAGDATTASSTPRRTVRGCLR